MSAGQSIGTGATVDLDDNKLRNDEFLRDHKKALRPSGPSLDKGDDYKLDSANSRSACTEYESDETVGLPEGSEPDEKGDPDQVDRPGFDLGGSTGKTSAGKGLGLRPDATEGKKGWRLPD